MSFAMSSTYDDTDVLSSSNTTTGLLYDFLGLFRNLDNASKGQTITHTGQAWEKSEKKTFL
jgi:hypothetical protein